MSLSFVAVAQREKEAKSLNAFLTFSLIGSLALHIGVLSLGGKFLGKASELENEPIEVVIVELPNPPKLELKQETEASGSGRGNNQAILGSGGSEGFGVAGGGGASQEKSPSPKKIASSNSSEVLKAQPAPQKLSLRSSQIISTPQQNQRTNLEKVPAKIVAQPKTVVTPPQEPSEIVTRPKPVLAATPVPIASVTAPVTTNPIAVDRSSQVQQLNNQRLNSLLVNAKNAREQASSDRQGKIAANLRNQAGSGVTNSNSLGNSAGNELRNGRGTGNGGTGRGTGTGGTGRGAGTGGGIGTGTDRGTGTGNGRGTGTGGTGRGTGNGGTGRGNNVQSGSTVATGTRNIERRTSPGESNSNSTNPGASSRSTCPTCKVKYPQRAKKRGLEGRAKISVDVDKNGNVTSVRLAQTSGHSELDKSAVEQARKWKVNTPNGAEQGVPINVDFAMEGSKRSLQNRERRRQRAAQKKPVASNQNTQTTPVIRTPDRQNTNTALNRSLRRQSTTVRRRRVDTLPPRQAFDAPQRQQRRQSAPSQTRLRESLRRLPRATSPNQTRRRRQQPQAISPNQTRLRQSLRLHKQSQSTPSNNSNEP